MSQFDLTEIARDSADPGLIRYHRQMLAIACVVGVLALVLEELPNGRVAVRGFPQFPIPHTCAAQIWFGIKCPGCGLTRSIIHLAEGNWRGSWHSHRLGGLMAAVIAFQIPYRLLALRRPGQMLIAPPLQAVFAYALIALLVVNWLVEAVAGRISSP
jgi:hypothetical protein